MVNRHQRRECGTHSTGPNTIPGKLHGQYETIEYLFGAGWSISELARRFGVTRQAIHNALRRIQNSKAMKISKRTVTQIVEFFPPSGGCDKITEMSLILHLPPETEAKLKEQAAAIGQAPEELALRVLEEQLTIAGHSSQHLSADEWIADIRAWAERHRNLPTDADDSRESIYAGRGE